MTWTLTKHKEKARWKQDKNAAYYLEHTHEATPHKTAATYHPSYKPFKYD